MKVSLVVVVLAAALEVVALGLLERRMGSTVNLRMRSRNVESRIP